MSSSSGAFELQLRPGPPTASLVPLVPEAERTLALKVAKAHEQ